MIFIIAPLLVSTRREAKIFGLLVLVALAITYFLLRVCLYLRFSVGAAIMSNYLVAMIFRKGQPPVHISRDARPCLDQSCDAEPEICRVSPFNI